MSTNFIRQILKPFFGRGRLRAEQTLLRAGNERFRKIFHVNPVAISVPSLKDGRLLEPNDAYWKLTGFDPKTSIGRTTVELQIWAAEDQRRAFVSKLIERRSLHNPNYEFVKGQLFSSRF